MAIWRGQEEISRCDQFNIFQTIIGLYLIHEGVHIHNYHCADRLGWRIGAGSIGTRDSDVDADTNTATSQLERRSGNCTELSFRGPDTAGDRAGGCRYRKSTNADASRGDRTGSGY